MLGGDKVTLLSMQNIGVQRGALLAEMRRQGKANQTSEAIDASRIDRSWTLYMTCGESADAQGLWFT